MLDGREGDITHGESMKSSFKKFKNWNASVVDETLYEMYKIGGEWLNDKLYVLFKDI